jgi:hypothetical protein
MQPLGGVITCICNSIHWQKVTLTLGSTTITFQGAGVGTPMKLADGATVFPMPPSQLNYDLQVQFEHSTAGAEGPFQRSTVEGPIHIPNQHGIQLLITSDDCLAHVKNNTLLIINYEPLVKQKSRAAREALVYAQ